MDNKKVSIILGVVCALLTTAICVQIMTTKKANLVVGQTDTENSLRNEVLKWKEKYDEISHRLDVSEKQLSKIREIATKNDVTLTDKEERITLNNKLLGITNLVGQGVEITAKDDPNVTAENIGIYDDITYHIVHDLDLRQIVNELKNAGAEAISINGQRIVNSTAITCIGNVIKINDKKITSPFVIKAIGLPESLVTLDRPGSYIDYMRNWGPVVTIKKSDKVEIPKYTGLISSEYIKQ